MSQKIVDYTLDSLTPANPDASLPGTVTGCTVVAGPGATSLGTYAHALAFDGTGDLQVSLPLPQLDRTKFCVRVVIKVDAAVTSRQVLAAANPLPFALYLDPGSDGSDFHVVSSVTTQAYGAGSASTQYLLKLQLGTWYALDLAYDTDTLATFVDGTIYSVHAFPAGTLAAGSADTLFAGVAASGTGQSFIGAMAALQLLADMPIELESQLDERRSSPQWYLTYKQEEIKTTLAFGAPTGEFYYDFPSLSWIQEFAGGILMYQDANGQAYSMHGAILATYWAMPNRAAIGYLISDEMDGTISGCRKNLFNRGGIYWSPKSGAIPVLGQIWVDYEGMGEAAAIGVPQAVAASIPGGTRQIFQGAQMYLKNGSPKAFEVHGAILAKYLSTGGTATWGFPVSNEGDLFSATQAIGRTSEFEGCTIYWSAATGAFEVHGGIRDTYRSQTGPSGSLGFPTSDETDIPGASQPARYNTFQNGSILWFGSDPIVCRAFDINLGRLDTKESEGWLRGENDVYLHATIEDNGHVIHAERLPSSGDSDNNNIYEPNVTFDLGPAGIIPNSPSRIIKMTLDVWDSDWPDDDDHLGTYEYTLEMANAWGRRDNLNGLFNSGSFDNINSITWSVSQRIDEALLTEAEKWWGVDNAGTDPLTHEQYAAAFSDVDSEPEAWDPTDWLATLYYDLVVKHLAKPGNCFGMSLSAIYSKKHRSILRLPLSDFKTWDPIVVNEFNIKHQYQMGAPAIWWFVGEFLSGKTHDPISVFKATRAAKASGCDPVLCIAEHYDFGGAPHCILPVEWNDQVTPWEMRIHDPNFPTTSPTDALRVVYVDPNKNTFTYQGVNTDYYHGGEWSGGRMHYMPYNVVNERPRTPVFEAIMLILSGVIILVGSDGETQGLTDENGVDLDAFGTDSINRLKAGKALTNKFVSIKGFNHVRECAKPPRDKVDQPNDPRRPRPQGVLTSEFHLRSAPKVITSRTPPNKRGGSDWTRLTLREYLCQVAPADIREKFARQPEYVSANNGRLIYHLAASDLFKKILGAKENKGVVAANPFPAVSGNFIHTTRAIRGGRMVYAIKNGLSQYLLTGDAGTNELHTFTVTDLGSQNSKLSVKSYRDQSLTLLVQHRLGAGNDQLRLTINNIPIAAGGELQINIKPGIGGVELVSAGQVIKADVSLVYTKQGTKLSSQFAVKEKEGVRIVPSTVISANQLKVSRINALFGASQGSSMVIAS
jgi:hypothetical protein